MKPLNFTGELLTANADERTLTYLLLPYGEPGHTNVGTVTASRGSVSVPEDIATLELNEEHDYKRQIGKFTRVEETDNGLEATVRIVNTSRGNDSLILAQEGLRTGISVEISEPKIRAGRLIAGNLTGAGLVVKPAFKTAQLITAADCGELSNEKDSPMENENLEVQAAPLVASNSKIELGKLTFDAVKSGASVQAALADQLTTDDTGKVYIKDQEVGELWEARKTERPFVNKVGVKPLTSLILTGTKKARTFAVADWAGNKVEIPTGKFTTSRENWQASAKAVAVDVAMELIEFGSADVISELYAQAVDSYIEQTEAEVKTAVIAASTPVAGGLTDVVSAVTKGAEVLNSMGARMDFVLLAPDLYSKVINLKGADAPWWLQGQGSVNIGGQTFSASGITVQSDADLAAGTLVLGDVRAVDYRESKEFRYRAIDLPKGGIDISLIKFKALKITDAGALLKFSGLTDAVAPDAPAV